VFVTGGYYDESGNSKSSYLTVAYRS